MADLYLQLFGRLPKFLQRRIHPLEFAIQDFVRSADSSTESGIVLDAGAGEARFRDTFRDSGKMYLAVDSGVGDGEWDYSGIDVQADLLSLPLGGETIDLALNCQVLEHVSDPARLIEELYRVLKPGGRLFLTAPQGWHEHQQPNDYFRFTRFALTRLFCQAGFQIETIEAMGGYFHYLGHRLTYIPKILFQHRSGWKRILLLPLEAASLGLFCFLSPLACYYLDRLDRKKEFTLCYRCRVRK